MEHTAGCLPLRGIMLHRAPVGLSPRCPGRNTLLNICPPAVLPPVSPSSSPPHSLMSLDSNPCLKGLLCTNSQGRHRKVTPNCHETPIFFQIGKQQHAIIIQIENYLSLSCLVRLQQYFNMSPGVTEIHKAFIQMKSEGRRKHRRIL